MSTPSAREFSVRWVDSFDDIPAALWDICFAPPLEGRWWYATMHQCGIEDQFTFSYAVVERSGEAVAIAPTFLMDVPLDVIAPDGLARLVRLVGKYVRFLRFQRTLFVGSPCSDEGTVGLVPGVELSEIAETLQWALDARAGQVRASMIVWKDFIDEDIKALAAIKAKHDLFAVTSFPGTRVTLPPGGYEKYFSSLKSSRRNKFKKKLRAGRENLPTSSSVVQHPTREILDEIFPLFWQTYLKGKTKFEKLNIEFFERIAAEPTSYFILLRSRADQRLVAFMLCFDCRPRAVNKFIGINYSHDKAFLYFQLWEAGVRWAAEAGFAEMQSGQTGYSAKLEIGNVLIPLTNLCRHRDPLVHRVFAWQARGISWKTIDHDLKTVLTAREKRADS